MIESPETRQQRILRSMIHDNVVAVGELAALLNVSPATVRRDLKVLQQRGLLHRTHGGATPIDQSFYASLPLDSSYEEQVRQHANAKRRIGLAAAAFVGDGDTVALTPGTTTAQVARSVHNRKGVTMIVTSVNVAMELSNRQDLTVFVPGGFMRPSWFSLIGPATIRAIRDFYVDTVFIGVNGIHVDKGLTSGNHEEAAVNRALIEQSRRRIVVADHTKLGAVMNAVICPTPVITTLITDSEATDEAIAPFEGRGIEVIRA
jgi:DeoR family transcriptional regulator, aga operon transcriptional repressor